MAFRAFFLSLLVLISISSAAFLGQKKPPALPTIPVEVASVKKMKMPKQVQALGNLAALQEVTISFEVGGRIAKIFFDDGQNVAQGMPIIQLDDQVDAANYNAAVTALQLSQTQYKRGLELSKTGAISQNDLDTLKANVEKDRSNVQSTQAVLNQKEIKAPFAGALTSFKVQVGDFVDKGNPIVDLVNIDQLKVTYAVPENLIPELQTGQQVEIKSSAYPDKNFYGVVNFISPSVDSVSRTVAVSAVVDNNDGMLSPGMFVSVKQNISNDPNALALPEQAVTATIKGYSVYKIVDNKAVLTTVDIGVRKDGFVQIVKGLQEGDKVVTAGQQKLQDGSPVQVVGAV